MDFFILGSYSTAAKAGSVSNPRTMPMFSVQKCTYSKILLMRHLIIWKPC